MSIVFRGRRIAVSSFALGFTDTPMTLQPAGYIRTPASSLASGIDVTRNWVFPPCGVRVQIKLADARTVT
jgi:hypothetical protein